MQAREYDAIGELDAQPWIATMVAAVRTNTGKNLAAAACETQPVDWWNAIVASYGPVSPSNDRGCGRNHRPPTIPHRRKIPAWRRDVV